ncbi:MAG: ATP synthase F1 subunit gamma [Porphyromonadaceae bacterium]|nr:ATP synthase F1 subunit gamma [Porphyromonadaceae bacterium]
MSTMRELKGRIGSVQSTQKITGAMKMISSAKLRKAEQAVRGMAPYREQLQATINNLLAADREYESPLTKQRPVQRVALILVASDEGLCGAYNANLYKALLARLTSLHSEYHGSLAVDVYPVGKKVISAVNRTVGVKMCQLDYFQAKSSPEELKRFVGELTASFLNGTYDRVECIYTFYKSVATQIVKNRTLLPVRIEEVPTGKKETRVTPYLYEPDRSAIFESVLPLYVNASFIEACLQSRTSEQGARIMAMQTASDNAGKLLDELRLEYNKLRQQGITNELLDIMGGSIA